ncbi:MAG: helix-turn-helix domain-containing protein, partial [Lachnospiraceae bacterium]|nr:helix-turn-helix domain-containing protein [Lachnospiraceae bacterium]
MTKIAKKICTLRKELNMTQVELADQLGISYQAVSNWERGNSMPDISKLPELAAIFNISIDELIGEKSVLIEAAVNDELIECIAQNEISECELDNTLPLLKPSQIDTLVKDTDLLKSEKHQVHISALLPYMDACDVQKLALKALEDDKSIRKYLPYMNDADVKTLADKAFEKGESLNSFLPFLDKEAVRMFADKTLETGGSIKAFFPFLSKEDRITFTQKTFESGASIKGFLP